MGSVNNTYGSFRTPGTATRVSHRKRRRERYDDGAGGSRNQTAQEPL